MVIYYNQLFNFFENQRINAYILKLTTNRYMSLILKPPNNGWINEDHIWHFELMLKYLIMGWATLAYLHLLPIQGLHLIMSLKILSRLTNDFHFKPHDSDFCDVAMWWSFHKRVSMSDNDLTKDLALSNVMN
jgi:hypothetical protein